MSCTNPQQSIKTIERNGVEIVCEISGKSDTALLFVHGAFIDMGYWQSQVDFFKSKYKVIVLDLPGHGKSGKNRTVWSIQEYGKDVCEVIKQLKLQNIILIGHSMGGSIILEVTEQCPASIVGFVGVDNFKNAGATIPSDMQEQIDQLMDMLNQDFASTSELFARSALLSPNTPGLITNRVAADFKKMDKAIGIEVIKSAFESSNRERDLLNKLKFKLNLINVDYYPTNNLLLQQNAYSGYEIFKVQGTSHYPMIENSDAFNETLQTIISSVGKK